MLVLASQSPRRSQLLKQIGLAPEVRPADIDESVVAGELPEVYVRRMAETKARTIVKTLDLAKPAWVIAADTSVVIDDEILGKPTDLQDLKRMMQLLSGRQHGVLTGICVTDEKGFCRTAVEATKVTFKTLDMEAVERYWHTGEPQDKAGGYGIQGLISHWVTQLEGCYFNVMGLPLARTVALLSESGYQHEALL
ncbi:MAG: septum formation inhibitor Maf [Gammaproteobacteria bacterium]|nr:septum formation inhibitor Maf [Gammaproteobacteria bacterium]